MKNLLLLLSIIAIFDIFQIDGLKISFITWNVRDNKDFGAYSNDIVYKLLELNSTNWLPDLYAITIQENCINCKASHLNRLALPFIQTLKSEKSTNYELLAIYDTRTSEKCEIFYCLSKMSMHGTTLIMILLKEGIVVSDTFFKKVGPNSFFANDEKGISVIGFKHANKNYCFGGLHLDVKNVESRQKCFIDILEGIHNKCNVIFFGGDFNTRPQKKSHLIPDSFNGGKNQSFLEEMKITDELSGSKPFSSDKNLLSYIWNKKNMKFIEPFGKAPDFKPTYSIDSSIKCENVPICYESNRFPSWTDRIIYSSNSKIDCCEYSSIPSLGYFSDHLPVYANCEIF